VTTARDTFERAWRGVALGAAAAALLALPAAAAQAADPALPDLVQMAPSTIAVSKGSDGHYLLGFTSGVGNVGSAPFEVRGHRDAFDSGDHSQPNMTAYQVLPDVAEEDQPVIGEVHYEIGGDHDHWHFQPFDSYELHRVSDNALVGNDQKEGFCLIDGLQLPLTFSTLGPRQPAFWLYDEDTFCDKGNPDALDIDEGISVGWMDEYGPIRGGQDIDLTGVPAGRYYLVHHVNVDGSIEELNPSNDVASAAIDITYPDGPSGAPAVGPVLRTCLASPTCPYTDPQPPPPPPPAGPDTMAPKLLLGGASRQRFLRGRAIYVYAKCDEVCTITASGRIVVAQGAKKLRTSSTKVTLRPGVRTKIKLPITARVRALINRQLKRRARVTVRVSLVALDAAGNRTKSKRLLTLVRF
jgi:hypothetical protein